MVRWLVLVALVVGAGCKDKKPKGLPPAQDWGTGGAVAAADPGAAQNPHAGAAQNPHAGVDMNNPHAGVDMNNPHAGVDMSNPHAVDMGGANPHAGLNMGGTDVTKMGLPPPDPNRPIDPQHHVSGVIELHPKAKDKVSAGTAVFVVVKATDASGQPSGPPLAVEKLSWPANGQLPFTLTEAEAMIAGTQLTGKVVVSAHYDQDGDALSKQPGDILGEVRVTVPADHVVLYLDQVL
jgi:hypothetical protein